MSVIKNKVGVRWPALLCAGNDAELLIVNSADQLADQQWRDDAGLLAEVAIEPNVGIGMEVAELIDSDGRLYTEYANDPASIELRYADRCYLLSEVVQLVRQHAALQGHCCVAKIGASSIPQAIQIVEHLNNE